MNPEIFREYDIRGVADRDLTDPVAADLGRAVGSMLLSGGGSRLALGRDCRLSSDRIRSAFLDGLLSTGATALDLGVIPTPLLYFSLFRLETDGGVMITGSHNAPDYNGLKIVQGRRAIHGEEVQQLRRIIESGRFPQGRGRLEEVSLEQDYRDCLREIFGKLERPLKVVVDCGNGAASGLAPQIYRDLGCQVVELFCEMDGAFPNHHPDPTVTENLRDLVRAVGQTGSDAGLAFDGDGDRIGLVDDAGEIVWGDRLMILYSREILRRKPGAVIIGDVKCSMTLFEDIAARGGRPVMWKAGHSLIKSKMRQEGAELAGEMSGHIFFADRYYGYDDALYAGARLLEILAASGKKASQLLADVPRTCSTPELRVDVPERSKFEIVQRAVDFFGQRYETVDIDGVRVIFDDGWGLIRASNTQPALVLRFEATSPQRLREIRDLMEGKLQQLVRAVVDVQPGVQP